MIKLDRQLATLNQLKSSWDGVLHIMESKKDNYEYMFVSHPQYGVSRVISNYDFTSVEDCLSSALENGITLIKKGD